MSGFDDDDDDVAQASEQNNDASNNDDNADAMAEDQNADDMMLSEKELSIYQTMTALQPERVIIPFTSSPKEMKLAEEKADEWFKEHELYVKSFVLNMKETAAAEAAAKNTASSGTAEAADEGGEGEEGEGEEGQAAAAVKKKAKRAPNQDTRVFDRDVSLRSVPVHLMNGVPEATVVKYLRPDLTKDKRGKYQSPANVRYKTIAGNELPLRDCALGSGKATPKEISAAIQRIGEMVVLGNPVCLGSIVTFPGHCAANFDELPLIDDSCEAELAQMAEPLDSITRIELSNCAIVVLLKKSDHAEAASDFLRVRPVRITVSAYGSFIANLLGKTRAEVAKDPANDLKKNRLAMLLTVTDLIAKLTRDLASRRLGPDEVVLRLYVYNTYKKEAWFKVAPDWFCSVLKTQPPGKKKPAVEVPAETIAEKRKENFRFITGHDNRTFVEITTCLRTDNPGDTGEFSRYIMRVPILPTYIQTYMLNTYKTEWADVVKDKNASGVKTPGAAAAAAITSTSKTAVGKVEAQPTKADMSAVTTSDATQKNVKKRTSDDVAAAAATAQTSSQNNDIEQEVLAAGTIFAQLSNITAQLAKPPVAVATPAAVVDNANNSTTTTMTTPAAQTPKKNAPGAPKKAEKKAETKPEANGTHQKSASVAAVQPADDKQTFLFEKLCKVAEAYAKETDTKKTLGAWREFEIPESGKVDDDTQKKLLYSTYQTLRAAGVDDVILEKKKRNAEIAALLAAEAERAAAAAEEQKKKKAKIVVPVDDEPELDDL